MPKLPVLEPSRAARGLRDEGVVFVVYAPFGTDEVLSRYPNPDPMAPIAPIQKQALVKNLQRVAAEGANVCALVDLFDDDSWLVEIPAFQPNAMSVFSAWKQDMSDRHALAGLLRRAGQRFPCQTLVLAIEGHGGGFVPDLDLARITVEKTTQYPGGTLHWTKDKGGTSFEPDGGSPALPMNSPELPMNSPELPATRMPMSTWALGEALRSAIKSGVPKPAVIHFNNCFNASVELLHTVAPCADFATGYANYDFFTAGEAYPAVFHRLRVAGSTTREQLARWFAAENGRLLRAKGNHPTVGATVKLARMKPLAGAVDTLSIALTTALQADATDGTRQLIRKAAIDAQHYDTQPGFELAVPDQFVDLGSFAVALQLRFPAGPVQTAAAALQTAAAGFWQYGDVDWPWMGHNPAIVYDFHLQHLGLNIFFPDPALDGVWDWRSPYYLSGKVDPNKAPAHRHVIPFLADVGAQRPRWVEFIVEYHKTTPFKAFFPTRPPLFPIFNIKFNPKDDLNPNPPGNPTGGPDNPTQGPAGGPKS